MNWYIGQEIVCIKTHSQGVVVKGKVYTIQGLKQGCCEVDIHVGIFTKLEDWQIWFLSSCDRCGHCEDSGLDSTHWLSETIFAPLEYDSQAIEELLQIEVKL